VSTQHSKPANLLTGINTQPSVSTNHLADAGENEIKNEQILLKE